MWIVDEAKPEKIMHRSRKDPGVEKGVKEGGQKKYRPTRMERLKWSNVVGTWVGWRLVVFSKPRAACCWLGGLSRSVHGHHPQRLESQTEL